MPAGPQIEPLPPINHYEVVYDDFAKDLYEPAEEVLAMTEAQVRAITSRPITGSGPAQHVQRERGAVPDYNDARRAGQ